METVPITIEVDAEAAKVYAAATPEEQWKMQVLLSLRLRDLTIKPRRSLREVMDDIGREAQANGLTPEILETLLRDEDE